MTFQELFIGPRLESSNWYCDDFMGKIVDTKKETPVIIRHFHTRNATLKPDSTIEWIETTVPSNNQQKSVMASLIDIHEDLKRCPYVQKQLKVPQRLPPDILVFDAICQDHVLNSQDLPWFLVMLLSCLEVAHDQKIYHGQICKKNISWYVNPTDGVTRVLLGNWLDAAIRKSTGENDEDAQKMVNQDLSNLKQVAVSLFPDEMSIRAIEEWFVENNKTAKDVKRAILDPDFQKNRAKTEENAKLGIRK